MRPFTIAPLVIGAGLLAASTTAAAQEDILWTFQVNGVDGQHPASNLIFDAKGNLYGTTDTGGKNGLGTAYELLPQANGTWQEKILYTFGDGGNNDGANPQSGMVFDTHGNLFGVTLEGGSAGFGTAYELSPQSDGSWTEKVLYQFGTAQDNLDGHFPQGTPVIDGSGNLYGVSQQAGGDDAGDAWELSPGSGGTWTLTPIYQFQGSVMKDGQGPVGGLISDKEGNLYGQTGGGGAAVCSCGTVFELTPQSGGTWKETILYSLQGSPNDASAPIGSLVFDSAGNLYGASVGGGADYIGAIYELSPGADGWTETMLHGFSSANGGMDDGKYPAAGPVFDPLGNLFVATGYGGAIQSGTVVELRPQAGGVWKESIVHSFPAGPDDGYYPDAGLLVDGEGNIYGTDFNAGMYGAGIVFELPSPDLLPAPVIFPSDGTYFEAQTVEITDTEPGVTFYYTTNGDTPTTSSEKYKGPIQVSEPGIIRAIADAPGFIQSKVSLAKYTFKTATPKLSLAAGKYPKAQTLKITDKTPHAAIYYTTDGKTPTTGSKKYTGPIAVSEDETIKAIAELEHYENSTLAEAAYTIETATPAITPDGGMFSKATSVTITDKTAGAAIYYTVNDTVPTAKSTKYTKAFAVSANETVKAIAIASGHAPSAVASANFTIK